MRDIESGAQLAVFYKGLPQLIRGGQLFEELVQAVYEAPGTIPPDGVAIDGGANKGLHTFPMSRMARRVIAFEPHPKFASNLQELLATRGAQNVDLREMALSHSTEMKTFYMANVAGGNALSIYPGTENVKRATKDVLCVAVDDIATSPLHTPAVADALDLDRLDFIKLDLDGHDFDALRGARKTIEKFKPVIAFEFGKERTANARGFTREEFFGFFSEINYDLFDICGVPFLPNYWSWAVWTPWDLIATPKGRDNSAIRASIDAALRAAGFEPKF